MALGLLPLTTMAGSVAENKIKVFNALKKNRIIIAATYQSNTGEKNHMSTLLTNAGIIHVNYDTQSIFINNDIIAIGKNGEFVSSNARVTKKYLNNLEYKIEAKSPNERYRIQVFTDVTCPHCQDLHKMVPKLNSEGITVEFILTSRNGDKVPAFKEMSAIQAHPDQLQALTNEMNGIMPTKIPEKASIQMALHQQAAVALGIRGTPTIYYKGFKLPNAAVKNLPEILNKIDESLSLEGEYNAHRVD